MSAIEMINDMVLEPNSRLVFCFMFIIADNNPMFILLMKCRVYCGSLSFVVVMQPTSIFFMRRFLSCFMLLSISFSFISQYRAKSFIVPFGISPNAILSLVVLSVAIRQFTASLSAESPPAIIIVL